ncbi:hypothetical protein Pcinc_006607 [Petrolisthes cinctipes]|uniref:Uncharacterized protein n=1 Tax=Petrolisthes cinctipes TaxID=88211 RepID=A0AAE1GAA1_PETCI|nr:hypothetical protein Pcinc_006607 [Petrolisthes cinctipes]
MVQRSSTHYHNTYVTLTNVTLDQFKARLDQFLQDLPDKPHLPHYYFRAPTNSISDWLTINHYLTGGQRLCSPWGIDPSQPRSTALHLVR